MFLEIQAYDETSHSCVREATILFAALPIPKMKDSKLTNKRTRRRPGIAAAAILFSCCATSAVAAFSAPTMKADLFRRSSNLRNSEIEKSTRRRGQGIPAGSPLEMICKDQHDFEMQVGHAMDVLRQDYPCILSENPGTQLSA